MTINISKTHLEALKTINEAIDLQTEYRSHLHVESKEYKNSLEDELKLQKNKSDLIRKMEINDFLYKYIHDKHLLLTDGKNHKTFFRVENKYYLVETIHKFVKDLVGGGYKVAVEQSESSDSIVFKSLNGKVVYYLLNYDNGTVVV